MKKEEKEQLILNSFEEKEKGVSSRIIKELNIKDLYTILKELVYFEYLKKDDHNNYTRTSKSYNPNERKNEKMVKNYEIVLNKIFTGSFLVNNLGHELINFLVDEKNQRYVYLNPWGSRGEGASKKTNYAFHVIESSIKQSKGIYELVAISEIDKNAPTIYTKKKVEETKNLPTYHGYTFKEIFSCGEDSGKAHIYTYKASNLYIPNDYRIFINTKKEEAKIFIEDKTINIDLMCNLQRSICYADHLGKKTDSEPRHDLTDLDVLNRILDLKNNYIIKSNKNVDINDLDDEQCFSVISDRTNLEDSMSNQIAYFLKRDNNLLYIFLHDFLGVSDIDVNEKFEIIREKEEKIDLLFKSDKHIIVVENKIDSKINGETNAENKNGKHNSQLSKYYDYINNKYPNYSMSFFVLAPEYNEITQEKLDKYYEKGESYKLKTYKELFDNIGNNNAEYKPLGHDASELGKFLFGQFIKSIEYLTWSTGKQHEHTAYIRLKQRILELENK